MEMDQDGEDQWILSGYRTDPCWYLMISAMQSIVFITKVNDYQRDQDVKLRLAGLTDLTAFVRI